MRERREVDGAVSVRFGPEVLRFEAADPDLRFILRAPHTAFVVDDAVAPTCRVRCRLAAPTAAVGTPDFWPEERDWELRRNADGGDEITYMTVTAQGDPLPRLRIAFAPDFGTADVQLRPRFDGDREFPIDFPLDEYIATRRLGRRGDLALHACALAEGDDALVFVGHSGAGKSTIAELAESAGAEVLSDDRTILTLDGESVRAWGTPWHGSYRRGQPRSAIVRGIFVLVQAPEDAIEAMHRARAYGELFVRTVQPTIEGREVEAVLATLEMVVGTVNVSSLHFRPTAAAYRLARASAMALVPTE